MPPSRVNYKLVLTLPQRPANLWIRPNLRRCVFIPTARHVFRSPDLPDSICGNPNSGRMPIAAEMGQGGRKYRALASFCSVAVPRSGASSWSILDMDNLRCREVTDYIRTANRKSYHSARSSYSKVICQFDNIDNLGRSASMTITSWPL